MTCIKTHRRRLSRAALVICLALHGGLAFSYESDVHYGLTFWLAMKADFASHEAEAIARGNQRVDSGGPQAIDVLLDYACALPDAAAALRVERAHFPSRVNVPAAPAERYVTPGSAPSRHEITRVLREARGKEGVVLSLFGAALHPYQDSWSHAGIPAIFKSGGGLKCSPDLAHGHSETRGGGHSHDADLTFVYPAEALAMARATYEVLAEYPPVGGRHRTPAHWEAIHASVRSFLAARTKTQKKEWFAAHGMEAVGFLEGITLPDGPAAGPLAFDGRLLPELRVSMSSQHGIPEDVRMFFDKTIAAWIGSTDLGHSLSQFLLWGSTGRSHQLLARLKLLKMRDHGSAAALIHKQRPLSAAELKKVASMTADASAYIPPAPVVEAVLPLVTKSEHASPLLPYITRALPSTKSAPFRMVAIMRLKHIPYDTVAWVAERTSTGWKLAELVVVVDH